MPPPVPRTRNSAATREAILTSARFRFLADSYDSVGLRDIAGDAGVDVALIGRYFGGKEELFRQVLEYGEPNKLKDLPGPGTLSGFLADLITRPDGGDNRDHAERLILLLRSASSPTAAAIVRNAFCEDVLGPLARLLDGPEGELRASLALSMLIGTKILDTIMGVGPLCMADQAPVRDRLVRIFDVALSSSSD